MGRFHGKVSIITGAARGIGRATATLFAREGSSVVIADLLDEGRDVADAINQAIGHEVAIFVKTDISREDKVKRTVDATLERFGKIDVLVNNAGVGHFKDILEISVDEWDRTINIKLEGRFPML